MAANELKNYMISSAIYDTLLQVGLRVISFILNAFIIRHVSQAVFAVMFVKLHLLYSTGLLLSQESFRRTALGMRYNQKSTTHLINLIWLGTLLSVPVIILGWFIWCHLMSRPPLEVTQDYDIGVILMAGSIFIEVFAEVPFILSQLNFWAKTKVIIEGSMQLLRSSLLAIGILIWPQSAVLVYAVSHVIGSCLYFTSYYTIFAIFLNKSENNSKFMVSSFRNLFPFWENTKTFFDQSMLRVCWSFFKQGWFKWILTEGELYLLNIFPMISLSQQGVYQVVNNLGSLAARLIFRSVEDASYKYFGQTLERGVPLKLQDSTQAKESSDALRSLLRNLTLGSFIIVTFGWTYSHALLWLYGGELLSSSGTLLMRIQFLYIVFLAINGISEAFTNAVMNEKQISRHNYFLVIFSVVYIVAIIVFTKLFGAIGLVLGNCLNMFLRILNSLLFIEEFFEGTAHKPIASLMLPRRIVYSIGTAFIITFISELVLYPFSMLLHIGVGAICLILLIYVLRFDLQSIIEKVLVVFDGLVVRLIGHHTMTGKRYRSYFVSGLHEFLFSAKRRFDYFNGI